MLTLSEAGATLFGQLAAGLPVGAAGPGGAALARRLLDAGLVHPDPVAVHTGPVAVHTDPVAERPDPVAEHADPSVGHPDPVAEHAGDPGGCGGPARPPARVTVVIPARDRAADVTELVTALLADDAPPARAGCQAVVHEVVVVDDGSRDVTAAAAAAAGARVVRHERPRGPAAARGTGARAALTELVAFCDTDVRPVPGWLGRLVGHLADPAVAAAAPRVASSPGPNLRARYEAARSPLDLGPRPGPVRAGGRISYVPSAALVIRRDLADFAADLRFGEDVDLVWRLARQGLTVRYDPAAVVLHRPRDSWRGWLRQRFGYGSSAAPLAARHPGPLRPVRGAASAIVLAAGAGAAARRAAAGPVAAGGGMSAAARAVAGAGGMTAAAGTVAVAVTAARLGRRLSALPDRRQVALVLALRGRRHVLEAAADQARRGWLPLLVLAGPAGRGVLAACVVLPVARDWWVERPDVDPLRYAALRLADDAAYCAGVWWGCLRARTAEPLLPAFPFRAGREGRRT